MLLFNFTVPSIVNAENRANNNIVAYNDNSNNNNSEKFDITEDTITINGVSITKEEVINARKTLKLVKKNVIPKINAKIKLLSDSGEYGGILTFDVNSASALKSIGVGVVGAFGIVGYRLGLVEHAYEFWRCSIDGYKLNIFFTPEGMLVNNYSISYSWFTKALMENVDKKEEPKTEAEEEDYLGEVLEGAKKLKDKKGKSKQWEKDEGYEKALEDFNSLELEGVRDVSDSEGEKKTGVLPDGRKITVRKFAKQGKSTLEIITEVGKKITKRIKIRYK